MITKEEWKSFRGSGIYPDHIMISIKGNAETSMAVTWRTSTEVKHGYVLCREKGTDGEWLNYYDKSHEFISDMDESIIHYAHITNLKPGTEYEYNCGDNEHRSKTYTFKTAEKDCKKFKFLLLSDIQNGDCDPPAEYPLLNRLIKDICRKYGKPDFILTAGDNTNCGQTDVQWTGLFDGFKGISESIPLMLTLGNHDDMGFESYFTKEGKYYSEKATYFCTQLKGAYNLNGPEGWQTATYAFDYGNAHFDILGTSGQEDINPWLIKDAENSDKIWKFGSHHFPVCYGGTNLACEDTYPVMAEGMEKLDVVFSGHEHSFARSYPRRNENLYSRPSQGTVHYNLGSGYRNPPGTRVVPKVWNTVTYEHEVELSMFAIAEVDGNRLTLTSYLEDGTIIDKCLIDKDSDYILPFAHPPKYNKTRMKFKGADIGLGASNTFCENKNGVWCLPAAVLFQCEGGTVERLPGKVIVNMYNHRAEYTEGSKKVKTDRGNFNLPTEVYRSQRGQLYVPAEGVCKPFDMRYSYFKENNFISIEVESEHIEIPEQP